MTPKSAADHSRGSPKVSESIQEGADRIVALIKTELDQQALIHKAQMKDLESRHSQLRTNTALVYASASLRIKRLEAELEDLKKEHLEAVEEACAEAEKATAELTQVKGCLDKLNVSLKENRMIYRDDVILFDDETVEHINELFGEAGTRDSEGVKEAFVADKRQASPLSIITAFMQYMKPHGSAVHKWEDQRCAKDEGDVGKHSADGSATMADFLDARPNGSTPGYSPSAGSP
jgi:hypothetical protein